MATHTAPAKSPVPSFVMAAGNVILPLILRSPLHGFLSKNMLLLSFKGRKSGKVYTFPVGYARDGATVDLVSNHGWWKNLRDHAPVMLWLQGQQRSGVANVLHSDDVAFVQAFIPLARKSPQLIKLYGIELDADGQPKPESVREVAHKFAVIRIQLA